MGERRDAAWSEVNRTAARQHGLVTRRQILATLSRRQLEHAAVTGRLDPIRPGVYRVSGSTWTWEQSVLAACLSVPGAVASFRSAAALHGLEGFPREGIEITVPARKRHRVDGGIVHESAVDGDRHHTVARGIPATSVARTLCDLTAVLTPSRVERAVDEALRRRMVTLRAIGAVFDDLSGRGRRRCTVMRAILERRLPGWEPGESDPEPRLADVLVAAGLPRPVHQHRVALASGAARIDLAYPEARIAIEYDGWDVHSTRIAFDDDRRRANDLVVLGWTVLRFTSKSSDDSIADTVRAALHRAGDS